MLSGGSGELSISDANGCSWGRLGELHRAQTASADTAGFDRNSSGLAAGYERSSADARWAIGAGLQYDAASLGTSGGAVLSGTDVQAGLLVKRNFTDATSLAASVVAGAGRYDTHPGNLTDQLATSDGTAAIHYTATHLRATHQFRHRMLVIAPFVDLGATRMNIIGALHETGADALNSDLAANGKTFTTAQSGFHLETQTIAHHTAFRPALDLSVTQFVGSTQSTVSGTFAGSSAPSAAPFVLSNRGDRTLFRIAPSLTIVQSIGSTFAPADRTTCRLDRTA